MNASMIGLDIAKSVFQVHGEDGGGGCVVQQRLRRSQVLEFFGKLAPARIGIEACGTAHYWGRELTALGHEVRLIPPAYVKAFVRRNKTDARDAAAICTALGRPDMRFVAVKSEAQQAARALERGRDLLVRQHTQLMNHVRSELAEFGIVAAPGRAGFAALAATVTAGSIAPALAALFETLRPMVHQIEQLAAASAQFERRIVAAARIQSAMRRLMTIPGVGPLTAHAIVTAIGEGRQFASARDFAAWCGLTRRVDQTANTRRQHGISRQGDNGVRKLLVLGASALLRHRRTAPERATPWLRGILARRPVKVAVIAQAARNARIAWALLQSGECYRHPQSANTDTASAASAA